MAHDSTTSSGDEPRRTLDLPIHKALGFEDGDFVSLATDGVRRAQTFAAEDLSFDYLVHEGALSAQDTWIGAQPVKEGTPGRAKASDVACVRVLYADFDFKDADAGTLQSVIGELSGILGAEPISVVNSGNGLHPRWKLAEALAPEDAAGVLTRWKNTVFRVCEEHGAKTDSVFDLPRVLRMPGTVNCKRGERKPVTVELRSPDARVSKRAVWSALDLASDRRRSSEPDPEALVGREAPSPARPEPADTLSERAVNVAVRRDLEVLEALSSDGWDGLPWHNTTRDVAFRLAKVAASPETTLSEEEVRGMFFAAAPRDDDGFDDEKVEELWESALERAEGEIYELIGSGDDLFADDMEEMLSAAAQSHPVTLDIDPSLSLDDLGLPAPAEEESDERSAAERYANLPLPLVPGFGGMSALRSLPLPSPEPQRLADRLQVLGEDISDFHAAEHVEYVHPHCPVCFPRSWRGQLNRWLVRNPGKDPSDIRPPVGRLAPGEGYLGGLDLLALPDSEMIIDGYVPESSIGLITGRGGTGKTFLALDIALTVMDSSIDRWDMTRMDPSDEFGTVNDHGGVMFLAGEGFHGLKSRVKAWLRHHGYKSAPQWLEGFTGRADVPNFFAGGADFEKLIEEVSARRPRLVVVDTLQKASAGADQNSASDMAVVHSRLAQLKHASGATVIVIAHSTKGDDSTRGSSSIEDDSDFILHVRKVDAAESELEVTKMRDSESPGPVSMYLQPVGNSVVVVPEPGSAAAVEDQSRIELMTAMHEIHSATSFEAEISITDIKHQVRTLGQREILQTIIPLIQDSLVVNTVQGKKIYRLTPKGRVWIESKSSRLFAGSRGLS